MAAEDNDVSLLLVDDRSENLDALAAILQPLGHNLLLARSGEDALKALLAHEVSVILLDVRMPGMDGYETAAHIKSRDRTRDVPIIFLTAEAAESEQVLRAFSAGAVDFVTKPYEPWALRAKVQVFVDLAEKTRLLREQSDLLRQRLDDYYARESAYLRKLASAAVVINSKQSLSEILRVLNESAREVIGAHAAETLITADAAADAGARSRSFSLKYEVWGATAADVDLRSVYDVALDARRPVRMTRREIAATLVDRGLGDIAGDHPLMGGWLAVPLIGRSGDVLGLIEVADKVDGDFDEQDELVLVQLAQLASIAIDNARRFATEHEVAHTLQRSMLPPRLPEAPGISTAARYEAGSVGTEVGGDWYDAVMLDDGRLLLTVGDVVGRGPAAAAVMGQLRTGWRAYALQQFPVAVLTRSLDQLLQAMGEGIMATSVTVVADARRRVFDVVSAGHPPPLVVAADGTATYIDCDPHTPLGVLPAPVYTPRAVSLPVGATLVLYTDGLVEERDVALDVGMRRLASVASSAVVTCGDDLEAVCDRILEIVGEGAGDDVALVAMRIGAPDQ